MEWSSSVPFLNSSENPASRVKIKERSTRLLARIKAILSSSDLDAVRQSSQQSDLNTLAAQLLVDLETP